MITRKMLVQVSIVMLFRINTWYLSERVFIFHFFQWLVNGRLGANGPNVLGLVEQDSSYERGLFQQLPKMVARHVLAKKTQGDHVENQNVLVK